MTVPDEKGENGTDQKSATFNREACCVQAASPVLYGVQGGVARALIHGVKCLPVREPLKSQWKRARLAVPQEPELERYLGNQGDGLDSPALANCRVFPTCPAYEWITQPSSLAGHLDQPKNGRLAPPLARGTGIPM